MQVKNYKGENLFMVIINHSNDIRPFVSLKTWEEAETMFNQYLVEEDSESFFNKVVKVEKTNNRMSAITVSNKKGWGSDYTTYIEVSSANAW